MPWERRAILRKLSSMRIISYATAGGSHLGVMSGDDAFAAVHELDAALPRTLDALLQQPGGLERLRSVAAGAKGDHRLNDVTLELPLQRPHGFWALALNFKTHIQETGLTTSTEHPQIFLRVPASFVPPGARMLAPPPNVARAFDAAAGTSRSTARWNTSRVTAR